jgi:hypothetical protein
LLARAIGPLVFHLAHLSPQRIERPQRLVRPGRILVERSAKKSRYFGNQAAARGPRLACSSVETNAGFVTSRGPSAQRPASASRLTRSRKPLFFGLKSHFNLQRAQPDTDASRAVINRILCSRGFRISQHHHLANSDCRRGCIPKRQQIAEEKIPEALALPDPERICDVRMTNTVAPASGIQLRASIRSPRVAGRLRMRQAGICRLRLAPASGISASMELWPRG